MVTKIASEENLAYPFTKPFPECVFEKHVNCMGLKRVPGLLYSEWELVTFVL